MRPDLDYPAAFFILTQRGYRTVLHTTTVLPNHLTFLQDVPAKIQQLLLRTAHCPGKSIIMKISCTIPIGFPGASLPGRHEHVELAYCGRSHLSSTAVTSIGQCQYRSA